jgi:hypothetical protein
VRGEQLTFFATEDVYFLTRLHFRRRALPVDPLLSGDAHLADMEKTYCSGEEFIPGSVVHIGAMDALVHRCITTMNMRIYGSLATQRISGGQLRIMQRELGGENFSWGLMLHTKMIGNLNWCQAADSRNFSFRLILVA